MMRKTGEEKRVVGIVQARMSSKRLPGKVLRDIQGKPMLVRVIERIRQAENLDCVVVATTIDPEDDPIVEFCEANGYEYYRGSLHDVLDRFYQTARTFKADVIVRFTGDCPLLDPGLTDHLVNVFLESGVDFAVNRLPPPFTRTFPIGLDVEVCSFQALERAWKEAKETYQREHVMPYLYDEAGRFRVLRLEYQHDYSSMRWTVDAPEDLELVRQIYAQFGERTDFTWLDVVALFEHDPQISKINAAVKHKTYLDIDESQLHPGAQEGTTI